MRQVQGFLSAIGDARIVESYGQIVSYVVATRFKEVPSFSEYSSLILGNKGTEDVKAFDETTDKLLEVEALKRLEERKRAHGQ